MTTSEQRDNIISALIDYGDGHYPSVQKPAAAWDVFAMTLSLCNCRQKSQPACNHKQQKLSRKEEEVPAHYI